MKESLMNKALYIVLLLARAFTALNASEVRKPHVFEANPEWGFLRLLAEQELFEARISYQITEEACAEAVWRLNQADIFKRGDLELAKRNYTSCLLAYNRSRNDFEKARSVIIGKFCSC